MIARFIEQIQYCLPASPRRFCWKGLLSLYLYSIVLCRSCLHVCLDRACECRKRHTGSEVLPQWNRFGKLKVMISCVIVVSLQISPIFMIAARHGSQDSCVQSSWSHLFRLGWIACRKGGTNGTFRQYCC